MHVPLPPCFIFTQTACPLPRSLKTSALKLHEKMAQMSTRIRELEEALGSLQATVSAEPHPLLDSAPEDEERPRSPIPVATIVEGGAAIGDHTDDLAEALGYLTIRPFGETQFHGETASSEVCNILSAHTFCDLTSLHL